MRCLLSSVALLHALIAPALAETIAVGTPPTGEFQILLTDEPCRTSPEARRAVWVQRDGQVEGCYTEAKRPSGLVMVLLDFEDQTYYSFARRAFEDRRQPSPPLSPPRGANPV